MPHGSSTGRIEPRATDRSPHAWHGPAPAPALGREASLRADASDRRVSELLLGLRLLALAVVAGAGALLPEIGETRSQLVAGILIGAALGVLRYAARRFGWRGVGETTVLAQVGVWTWLVHLSGDQRSPLFVGYVFEVALAGAAFRRRGCVLAALACFAAYLLEAWWFDRPLRGGTIAVVGGVLALGTVLTGLLIEVIERQRHRIEVYQRALRERADTLGEELRLLGDYLSGALIGLDDLGRVVSLNPAFERLLGFGHEHSVGQPWQEVIRADAEGARAIVATLCEGTPRRGLCMALGRADGGEAVVEAELWVSPSEAGRRTYLLARELSENVTGTDPLRRLGEASACVAHQMKNSLHALSGLATEIARDAPPEADRENLDRLQKVLKNLGALSEDVLAMAGGARPPAECVPVADVLASASVLLRRAPGQLAFETVPDGLRVRAHRGQLVHALFNLLDNASRVTPPDQRVRIRVTGEDGSVVIEIADGGPGMSAVVAHGNGPAPSSCGSGFGVLAARRFVEENGGRLSFHPGPEGGTICRVAFPLAAAHAAGERS